MVSRVGWDGKLGGGGGLDGECRLLNPTTTRGSIPVGRRLGSYQVLSSWGWVGLHTL